MRRPDLPVTLSFESGFADTAGFLGLQRFFSAHVTENFGKLAAARLLGTHGAIAKLLAFPELALVIALAGVCRTVLPAAGLPVFACGQGLPSVGLCSYHRARTVPRRRCAAGATYRLRRQGDRERGAACSTSKWRNGRIG